MILVALDSYVDVFLHNLSRVFICLEACIGLYFHACLGWLCNLWSFVTTNHVLDLCFRSDYAWLSNPCCLVCGEESMVVMCCYVAYCVVVVESAGRQIPMAFLERVKEDFSKRYGGGKATTAKANSLNREFGYFRH